MPMLFRQPLKSYTLDYFINHFSTMGTEDIGLSTDDSPCDAWEWLNAQEAMILYTYIKPFGILLQVNDGADEWASFGETPKDRIVTFLKWVKEQYKDYK